MKRRTVDSLIVSGLVLALVGGALLYASLTRVAADAADLAEQTHQTASNNSGLICSLGEAISAAPISRRPDEGYREFARRVHIVREFVADLKRLDDCDPAKPIQVRIAGEYRDDLHRGQYRRAQHR